jgi:repressor LexA
MSPGTVGYWLQKLGEAGLVRPIDGKHWPVELIGERPSVLVPLIGEIHAGQPIVVEERIVQRYRLSRALVGEGEVFMLQVRGDSMIEAGVLEGDFVVVNPQKPAVNKSIVAAVVPDEGATIKYYSRRAGQVELRPANPAYKPIDGAAANILGSVVTVLRQL